MKREDLFESIEKQIIAEKVYRSRIKKAIGEFKTLNEHKKKKNLIAEKIFRAKIRNGIKILIEKKTTRIHSSTGMNALEDLFSNSNLLSVLESDYKILTTSKEQRDDYKQHIMQQVINLFKLEDLAPEKEGSDSLSESLQRLFEEEEPDISITVDDADDLPDDKVVGPARDEMEEEEDNQNDENAESIDPDKDLTGRNRADGAFNKIQKSIEDAYNTLGNPADKEEFKTYLIANLRMYFNQFEDALKNDVKPVYTQDVEDAVSAAEQDLSDADQGAEEGEDESGGDLDLGLDI